MGLISRVSSRTYRQFLTRYCQIMEDPFEDTEWNDILRRKGILPKLQKEKQEDREEADQTEEKVNLDELEDDEFEDLLDKDDDEFLQQYRKQRIATLEALKAK